MSTLGRQHDPNNGVRRVILTTLPALHPFSLVPNAPQNYFCYGHDMKGFQVEIDLQALPPGVTINQLAVNQVWWVDKRTSLYRLYSYGGVYDPVTRQIITTTPIQTAINGVVVSGVPASGQSLVATSTSGATWTIISGGTTVSGSYLPISGGTISGNLTVASGLTVSGSLSVASEVDSGTMTVGGNLTVTGTSTHIGNATFSGNANVSGTLTVSGAATLNGTAIPLSSTLLYSGGPLGTPSSAALTNATGLPLTTGVTGTLPVANGGLNATTTSVGSIPLGSSTTAYTPLAIGASGTSLTSNGTTASWAAPTLNYVQASLSSPVAVTTTFAATGLSISLTAGTWLLTVNASLNATTNGSCIISAGPTSASNTGAYVGFFPTATTTSGPVALSATRVIVLASTTTIYLNAGYYISGAGNMLAVSSPATIPNATELVAVQIG